MWGIILSDLKAILAKIEAEEGSAITFLLSFLKEAVTEEEAALFPAFQALATKILSDEAQIQGLNVQQRVLVIVADFSASLPADIALAKMPYSTLGLGQSLIRQVKPMAIKEFLLRVISLVLKTAHLQGVPHKIDIYLFTVHWKW